MENDRTTDLLQQFRDGGLRTIATWRLDDPRLHLHFYITSAAEALIKEKKFLKPDDFFSLDRFHEWLLPIYKKALQYLQSLAPELKLQGLHVVFDDFGDEREQTASSAKHNSSIIIHDLLRWHEMYKGAWSDFAPMLVLHELAHIATYRLCPTQDKLHREMTAVVIERIFYHFHQQRFTPSHAAKRYLQKAGKLEDANAVLAVSYSTNLPLRYIVDYLLRKIQDGTYCGGVRPMSEELHIKMMSFAKTYLHTRETGDIGFDTACRELEIISPDGTALILETLRFDCHAELIATIERLDS